MLDGLPPFHSLFSLEDLNQAPVMYCLLANTSLNIESTQVSRVLKLQATLFPILGSNRTHTADHKEMTRALLKDMTETGEVLRRQFVDVHGNKLRNIVDSTLCQQATIDLSTPSPLLTQTLEALKTVETELTYIYGPAVYKGGGVLQTSVLGVGDRSTSREQTLVRAINRQFAQKISVCGTVRNKRPDMLVAVLKMLFKCLLELVRKQLINTEQFQCIQVDLSIFRSESCKRLSQSLFKDISIMCDEVLNSASERCIEAQEPMDDQDLAKYAGMYEGEV